MDFSLVAPRGNKRKPKKVKIYLDTVWFTLPISTITHLESTLAITVGSVRCSVNHLTK